MPQTSAKNFQKGNEMWLHEKSQIKITPWKMCEGFQNFSKWYSTALCQISPSSRVWYRIWSLLPLSTVFLRNTISSGQKAIDWLFHSLFFGGWEWQTQSSKNGGVICLLRNKLLNELKKGGINPVLSPERLWFVAKKYNFSK